MLTTAGAATPPTLDGLHLVGVGPDSIEIVESEMVGTIRMAAGGMREQRLAPAPGEPVIRRWVTITLDYRHIGDLADAVDARLAFPGPHAVAVWKHVQLGYVGDGSRADWTLPWRLAPHVLTPPGGAPLSRFAAEVRVGFEGAALVNVDLAPDAFETATPLPGTVLWEVGGLRFRVVPPAAGAKLIAKVVPLYRCVVVGEDQPRRYNDWVREPRRIALTEAA